MQSSSLIGKNNPRHQYSIAGDLLDPVEQHSDLGVIITRDLSWSAHIEISCGKANSNVVFD